MRISACRFFGCNVLLACAFLLIQALVPADVSAQEPMITAMTPGGAVTWTNMSTNCVAVMETLSPATSGEWHTVYAELPTALVSQAQMIVTNERSWFRAVNADNSTAPTNMVLIPGGSNRGTNPLETGESYDSCVFPETYSLTVESFYMDRYEVTMDLWDDVKNWNGGNGYSYDEVGSGKAPDHPVHTVAWYDCVKWCNARSQKDGRRPVYYTDVGLTQVYKTGHVLNPHVDGTANGYRLPTDEEWEYAARGGAVSRRFPWGENTISHSQANYNASALYSYDLSNGGYHPLYSSGIWPYTSPVGAFAANGYGLYDMAGNVMEWCSDWYPCYPLYHVLRGGSWIGNASHCRVGDRPTGYPGNNYHAVGFRAVLSAGQQ